MRGRCIISAPRPATRRLTPSRRNTRAARHTAAVTRTAARANLAGLWKTLSYGLGLLLHAVSTLATYHELLSPFGTNHLFLAAVPVLAAFITLFLLRRHDTLWSAGKAAG